MIDAVHADQLHQHGGLPGVRDENVLESALARARQKWHYGEERDIAVLAAANGFGLVRNHPYRDGNKRIGVLAVATFLGVNGYDLDATESEVVATFVTLAEGSFSEAHLAEWIREHLGPAK